MLKEILESLEKNGTTVSELSEKFEVSKAQLQDQINLLIHMGYLELLKIDEKEKSLSCKSCPHLKECIDNIGKISTYILTDKGRKLIEK